MTPEHRQPSLRVTRVAGPLFVELALAMGLAAVGLALAARLGDTTAAAYLLTQHLLAALTLLLRVVGAGVSVVVAHALGRAEPEQARQVACASLGAASAASAVIAAVVLLAAQPLWWALNAPLDLRPAATSFLWAMLPALALDAWLASMSGVLRAYLQGPAVLRITSAVHLLHLALAVPLMLGLPEAGALNAGLGSGLGLEGFALALAMARLVGLALMWRLWAGTLGRAPGLKDMASWRHHHLRGVIRIGWPSAAEAALYRLSFMVGVAAAGVLGSSAVAAQGYALQINHLVLLFALALGLGVEIVTGHRVGSGALRQADASVRRILLWAVAGSAAVASAAALAAPWLLGVFTQDPAVIAAASTLLVWSVLLEPGRAFNLVLVNALRATGDTRFALWAALVSMPLVLAGGGWWLAIEQGLGLTGLWMAYAADEWLRGGAMWLRWQSRAWVPAARQSRREARQRSAAVSPAT